MSIEELLRHTFNEILNFYRIIFSEDDKGRNPAHYGALGKYNKSNKTVMALLDFGLEKDELSSLNGYPEFESLCAELQYLDDNPNTNLDPKKRFHIMDEMRHLLNPLTYNSIMKEFKHDRKLLI